MSLIEWKPSLAVGVELIDTQHQELIGRINKLMAAMQTGKAKGELTALMAYLGEYVETHFREEEALMERVRYRAAEAHKEEHAAFERDYAALRAELARDGLSDSLLIKVNNRVCMWIVGHIMRADRAVAAHIQREAAMRAG